MRYLVGLALPFALGVRGCTEAAGIGSAGGDAGKCGGLRMKRFGLVVVLAVVGLGALTLAGCGGNGDGGAPAVTRVSWEPIIPCERGTASAYAINVLAMGSDLAYSGSVDGCEGAIEAFTVAVFCPNTRAYDGVVTVTDGNGVESEPFEFTILVCESGSEPFEVQP